MKTGSVVSGSRRRVLTSVKLFPHCDTPAELQPQPQDGLPAGRVFLVEGQVTAIVLRQRTIANGPARAASQMHDLRERGEKDPAAARAERGAQVHVLFVKEVTLVERPACRSGLAADEQTGAADPVDLALARHQTGHVPPGDRAGARSRALAKHLPRLGNRPQ